MAAKGHNARSVRLSASRSYHGRLREKPPESSSDGMALSVVFPNPQGEQGTACGRRLHPQVMLTGCQRSPAEDPLERIEFTLQGPSIGSRCISRMPMHFLIGRSIQGTHQRAEFSTGWRQPLVMGSKSREQKEPLDLKPPVAVPFLRFEIGVVGIGSVLQNDPHPSGHMGKPALGKVTDQGTRGPDAALAAKSVGTVHVNGGHHFGLGEQVLPVCWPMRSQQALPTRNAQCSQIGTSSQPFFSAMLPEGSNRPWSSRNAPGRCSSIRLAIQNTAANKSASGPSTPGGSALRCPTSLSSPSTGKAMPFASLPPP